MECLTNTERKFRDAPNLAEAGIPSGERQITRAPNFGGVGNASNEAVRKSFQKAAKKQLSGRQG